MENNSYNQENQLDKNLEKVLQTFDQDFAEDFTLKVMKQISKLENPTMGFMLWNRSFKRIVIPAAAVLAMLFVYSLYSSDGFTTEQVSGISSISNESSSSLILNVYGF